jgi:predicted P-loop ATPase
MFERKRRFWPVSIARVNVPGILADRNQLWTEAVVAFDRGDQWYLSAE